VNYGPRSIKRLRLDHETAPLCYTFGCFTLISPDNATDHSEITRVCVAVRHRNPFAHSAIIGWDRWRRRSRHVTLTLSHRSCCLLTFDSLAIPDTALRYGIVIISTLRHVKVTCRQRFETGRGDVRVD
jgi:hypothetical protein